MTDRRSWMRRLRAVLAGAAVLLVATAREVSAHVVRIEIVSRQTAFNGRRFGAVGQDRKSVV